MHKLSTGRKIYTKLMRTLMLIAAFTVIALLLGVVGYIIFRGVPNVTLKLITSKPSLLRNIDGILPNILNTVYIVLITLVFVLPIGVGSAIYLTEYAKNKKIVRAVELAAETLSGIPSNYLRSCRTFDFRRVFQSRHKHSRRLFHSGYNDSPNCNTNNRRKP